MFLVKYQSLLNDNFNCYKKINIGYNVTLYNKIFIFRKKLKKKDINIDNFKQKYVLVSFIFIIQKLFITKMVI